MKKRLIILWVLLTGIVTAQVQQKQDTVKTLDDIIVTGKAPVSKEKISKEKLSQRNLGQDVPYLLKNNLSVVTTSDAGAGIGYTGIRIRGTDQTRINVTLNGIPLNDPDSQGVFWVDIPDIASSVSNLTIQRGVGTTTNGTGSFGASININLDNPSKNPFFQVDNSIGSFKTHKHTFSAGTGTFWNGKLSVEGRVSFIKSDGYIDRASSNLFSYYTAANYQSKNTTIKFTAFGGQETTYQAWNGIDAETMHKRRTFNYSGAIYDEDGNIIKFYNNQIDFYKQNHYQLSLEQGINDNWKFVSTLHYTKGFGYYEEYKQDASFQKYKLENVIIGGQTITETDLIRRKFLDNDFYGVSNQLIGNLGKWNLEFGLSGNIFQNDHYGQIIWAKYFSNGDINHEYYRNKTDKREASSYAKAIYKASSDLEFFGDIQYRNIHYKSNDVPGGENPNEGNFKFSENYDFLNPKVGAIYNISHGNLYLTYGMAHREPNRSDILDNGNVKPEVLHNVELGIQKHYQNWNFSTNVYYMYYIDQLVLSGKLNDVGEPIRINSGKSYRLGLEAALGYAFSPKFSVNANSTFSINKNIDFINETSAGVQNLGNTTIAFSPGYIGNISLEWKPIKNISAQWINQYIGKQYLSNTESDDLKLKGYFTSNILLEYKSNWFHLKDLRFTIMLNNIFDSLYENNGAVYDNQAYYFPQAGFNFLTGLSLKF